MFFKISDMRWGVRDEVQDDHNTTALCLSEIVRCQEESRGPSFVVLLISLNYIRSKKYDSLAISLHRSISFCIM